MRTKSLLAVASTSLLLALTAGACSSSSAQPTDLRGDGGLGSSGGDGGEGGVVTGTCPDPLTGFTMPYAPPAAASPGKCSDAALSAIASACYGAQKSAKACADARAAQATCAGCLYTDEGAAAWSAVVTLPSLGGAITLNWPGCVALLEGKSGPGTCGKAANDYGLCPEARCRACAGTARNDCTSSAFGDGSACKAYEKPLQDCLAGSSIPQADLQNKCGLVTPALGTEEWFKRLGKTFCG